MNRTAFTALLLMAAIIPGAFGYSFFVRYVGRSTVPVPMKFDLQSLPASTVQVFVSEPRDVQFAPGDSAVSLQSQIRLALRTWNDVPTSELRVAFGGTSTPGASGPGVDVIFDEVPPGLLALGGPSVASDGPVAPGGFVPIQRSVVILRKDLSAAPVHGEAFFLSLAHEIGHALGLQHSLASGLMATEVTRGVTKAHPLSADDVAGISALYPAPGFKADTGTINGRVTLGGSGVHMAHVMALSTSGAAVSALTNIDGTYRIEGLPPGRYYVVAQTLPPKARGEDYPAGIQPPVDDDGKRIQPGNSFETLFYPGVRDARDTVNINAGSTLNNINFSVQRQNGGGEISGVRTYGFVQRTAIKPAHVSFMDARPFFIASGMGLLRGNSPVPSLNASVIGNASSIPSNGIKTYPQSSSYIQVDLILNPFAGEGYRHVLFTSPDSSYVLPLAFRVTSKDPPQVTGVFPGFEASGRTLTIFGTNFSPASRVLADGVPLTVRSVDDQRIVVIPPIGPAGHRAVITVLNPDGQSSAMLQEKSPPTATLEAADGAGLIVNAEPIPAGGEGMVEIWGVNAQFTDDTVVSFGTPDVTVRKLWIAGPSRIIANVSVSPGTPAGPQPVTVHSGLAQWSDFGGFRTVPPNPRQLGVVAGVSAPAQPGATVTVQVLNAPAVFTVNGVSVTVNDRPAQVVSLIGNVLTFQIPQGTPAGVVTLRLQIGSDSSLPVAIPIA